MQLNAKKSLKSGVYSTFDAYQGTIHAEQHRTSELQDKFCSVYYLGVNAQHNKLRCSLFDAQNMDQKK